MMGFITIDDVSDEILKVNENDIEEANRFVTDIGIRLGVAENSFIRPPRYMTRRLAIVYACYLCALRNVGADGSVIFDGKENADIYAQKLAFFRNELQAIEARMAASDYTDQNTSGGRTIALWRG